MYTVEQYSQCVDTVANRITSPLVEAYLDYRREVEEMIETLRRNTLYMAMEVPDGTPMVWRYRGLWVEVYRGEFIVDKITYGDVLYKILQPITWTGQLLVSSSGEFFDLYPRYGFHLVTEATCIGEVPHDIRNRDYSYKVQVAQEIVKALQIINMDSLGTEVVLPPDYPNTVFSRIKGDGKREFLEKLKAQNLIQEVTSWT